jgi:PKD repeat protein
MRKIKIVGIVGLLLVSLAIIGSNVYGGSNGEIVVTVTPSSNNPPNAPSNPSPADGETNVSITTDLSWQCSDPDGDALTYDVYFGTSSTPPKVASNITSTTYDPGTLQYNTTYYWRIVAWDSNSSTSSPVWSFTTVANGTTPNQPPTADFSYSVNDLNVTFTDESTDPDGTIVNWTWNFGDGSISYEQNPTHRYADYGNYTVTLTVTDDDGATDSVSYTVSLASSSGGGGWLESNEQDWNFWMVMIIAIFGMVAMVAIVMIGSRRK